MSTPASRSDSAVVEPADPRFIRARKTQSWDHSPFAVQGGPSCTLTLSPLEARAPIVEDEALTAEELRERLSRSDFL
jgi:hypothetical protein